MANSLSVLGVGIPAGVRTPDGVAKHLVAQGKVSAEEVRDVSKAIAERCGIGVLEPINRDHFCHISQADLDKYAPASGGDPLSAGLKPPVSHKLTSSSGTTGSDPMGVRAVQEQLKQAMEDLRATGQRADELLGLNKPKGKLGGSPKVRREPIVTPGKLTETRVSIETEMASVKLGRSSHASVVIAAVDDPGQPNIKDWSLLRSVQTTTIKDQQTQEEVELPVFTVELESGQGAATYFIEISTGPIPYGETGEGVERNRKIIDCWLRTCEKLGGSSGAMVSLSKLAAAFNTNARAAKLSLSLDVTPGGELLDKQSDHVFTIAAKSRLRLSLPSQANVHVPFVNVGKPGFLSIFNKNDARMTFQRCQVEAAAFVESEIPEPARTDNMRSLFSIYFFHLTRLHSVCQTNDRNKKVGDPFLNEKDILNCLCKAPINDLVRTALDSYEKSVLFDLACLPDADGGGFGLNPVFDAALNRALANANVDVRVKSDKTTEDYTKLRNESLYFEQNPNEIFLPSSRYRTLDGVSELEEEIGNYGDRVSPANREYLKEQKWGRRSAWKREYPLVMTDNLVEPILTEGTAVAVWEQRSRNSPLTLALLPEGTSETTGATPSPRGEVFRQVCNRE